MSSVNASPESTRLLVVESSLRENGGIRVCLDYARRWAERGVQVRLALVQHAAGHDVARPDARTRPTYLTAPHTRFRYTAPLAARRLCSMARDADLVLAGSEEGNGLLLGWLAARLTGTPFAVLAQNHVDVSIDTWVPRPLRGLTRRIHTHCDASICVSDGVRDGLIEMGLPAARAHVVRNGVDTAAVRAAAARHPVPDVDEVRQPTVVASGRLADAKGFSALVAAHARVIRSGRPHRLLILGEGPARASLEAEIAEFGVSDSVSLPGFVAEPYGVMSRAELFVLSSRVEGTPLVLLEAMALGLPIISTRCGSAPSALLDEGSCGRLVDVDAVDQLAEAIADHLDDPSPLLACADRASRSIRDHDAENSAEAARKILVELATAHGPTAPVTPTGG